MTTISEMSKMEPLSEEWFTAAFEDCTTNPFALKASRRICSAFNIIGQADPAYIANVISQEYNNIFWI